MSRKEGESVSFPNLTNTRSLSLSLLLSFAPVFVLPPFFVCGNDILFHGARWQEESHGRCCRTHKGVDMVYVNSRRCEVVNCRRAALWRENAHGRRRVCNDHRQDGVAYSQMAPMCAEKVRSGWEWIHDLERANSNSRSSNNSFFVLEGGVRLETRSRDMSIRLNEDVFGSVFFLHLEATRASGSCKVDLVLGKMPTTQVARLFHDASMMLQDWICLRGNLFGLTYGV